MIGSGLVGSKSIGLGWIRATALLGIFCSAQAAVSQVIYTNDFEHNSVGAYSVGNLNADWNSPSFSNGVDEGRTSIVNDGSTKVLAVTYPAGEYGSGDDKTGAQWKLDFGQGYEAVELEYRLKFGPDFDFVRGGKLPGLIGGIGNVGGNKPNGTDGFSARMMWRTNGSAGSPLSSTETDKANIVQYVYHPDQPDQPGPPVTTFGDNLRWDDGPAGDWKEFESGQWYRLRHRVVMNTPGQNDGVIQAWLDGELVLNVTDLRFRDVAGLQIDQMYFSTFFGGGSDVWATSKEEVAYFDDFRITAVSPTAVPEPSSASLIALLATAVFVRRRKRKAISAKRPSSFEGTRNLF